MLTCSNLNHDLPVSSNNLGTAGLQIPWSVLECEGQTVWVMGGRPAARQ